MRRKMAQMQTMMENTRSRWSVEAELAFAAAGRDGKKMTRRTWANGETMVGWEGCRCNQEVPLERALAIWRAGWKIRG